MGTHGRINGTTDCGLNIPWNSMPNFNKELSHNKFMVILRQEVRPYCKDNIFQCCNIFFASWEAKEHNFQELRIFVVCDFCMKGCKNTVYNGHKRLSGRHQSRIFSSISWREKNGPWITFVWKSTCSYESYSLQYDIYNNFLGVLPLLSKTRI